MFAPQHCGLIFTDDHVQIARRHKKKPPFDSAWERLNASPPNPNDPLDVALWNGLRYRFNADAEAAEAGISLLDQALAKDSGTGLSASRRLFALAQTVELLREHPALSEAQQARYGDILADRLDTLSRVAAGDDMLLLDGLWLAVAETALGVVLEHEDTFTVGTETLRRTIAEEVHPEGYLRRIVQIGPEPNALRGQILAAQALALIAEIASHAGVDLWSFDVRGVSVTTATTYPLYYYFYPEKWRWNGEEWKPSNGVEMDEAQQIFREHAGFLEVINGRYDKPLKAVKMILDELRPVHDPLGGGLVTLSHGLLERRGLFG